MKLTKEQAEDFWNFYHGGNLPIREALTQYEFSHSAENSAQWYHCSERLPTAEDAGSDGPKRIPVILESGAGDSAGLSWFDQERKAWWTPVPKNLVKPTPPDPFEAWWNQNCYSFPKEVSLYQVKAVYELGQANPHQIK
jgi:hypothetical protein